MTHLIEHTLYISRDVHRETEKHLLDLMIRAQGPTKRRYAQSHMVWDTAMVSGDGFHFELELQGWREELLWDLWGVIPRSCTAERRDLARFLERSPLIKLAECAE